MAQAPDSIHVLQKALVQQDVLLDEAEWIAAARWTLRQLVRSLECIAETAPPKTR